MTQDGEKATRRAVINALTQPGGLFPSGITVIYDGQEIALDILDDAMTWVTLDRQAAKRSSASFDPIASLTRHLPKALEAHRKYLRSLEGRPHGYSAGRGHEVVERRAAISPRRPLETPLLLSSQGA
ncbi:hypothetical protein [Teichococcus vastitatis]|uniref:hypothetical protein n=1 Tax=Teichococcus vastitatis TaxID=2307076 RepID=UPI000E72E779|nr:hypothetical protein [Pseudoroseomonas vastitatis]